MVSPPLFSWRLSGMFALLALGCSSYGGQTERGAEAMEEEAVNSPAGASGGTSSVGSGGGSSSSGASTSGDGDANDSACTSFMFSDNPMAPSDLTDLSIWRLELPVEEAGNIRRVHWDELCGFEELSFFHLGEARDSIRFRAPVEGHTTSGSSYPRTELREMDGTSRAYWSAENGVHTMEITQRIVEVPPAKPHIVAGQIHDDDDDVIMIRFERNSSDGLFVEAKGDTVGVLDENYQLGEWFTVRIVVEGGVVAVYFAPEGEDFGDPIELAIQCLSEAQTPGSFCYFKAGAYTQSNLEQGDSPGSYGEVEIRSLVVTHE